MLSNSFFQSLGRSTSVHAASQVFGNNITSMMSSQNILLKKGNIFVEENAILVDTDPKQLLLTADLVCFCI